jgi:membrane protease YdiL (CAAX protease family)
MLSPIGGNFFGLFCVLASTKHTACVCLEIKKQKRIYRHMKSTIKNVLASPAAWFFTTVWLASLGYLLLTGNGVIGSTAFALGILVFSVITISITENQVETSTTEKKHSPFIWLQIIVVLFFILLTGYRGFVFNVQPARSMNIPVWSWFGDWFSNLGGRYLYNLVDHSPGLAAANFAVYFLIPFVLLLLLSARLPDLGLGKGHCVWRVVALWVSIPLVFFVINLVNGSTSLMMLGTMFLGNLLRNGFSEEFLFRGALQTRLKEWMGSDWALVLQALIFAVWHLGTDTQFMGGDVWQGLALGIASHSIFGLAMGVIFQRTRNLIAPSIVHVVINMFGN